MDAAVFQIASTRKQSLLLFLLNIQFSYLGEVVKSIIISLMKSLADDLLTHKAPNKNCSRRHFNFLHLSFEENKA